MSRLMSVAMTTDAVIERRKTVTRRKGWWLDKNGRRLLKPGDTLTLCKKVQGRKPGEPIVRLAEVEVVSVRREPLCAVGGPEAKASSLAQEICDALRADPAAMLMIEREVTERLTDRDTGDKSITIKVEPA